MDSEIRSKTAAAGRTDATPFRSESLSEAGSTADSLQPKHYQNILETIGRTPLVRLNKITQGCRALVLAKIESFNPGGSVKDRIGIHIIQKAEQSGKLKPGGTIVEATSGNTGLGLAIVAVIKGYRCVCVMPDKVSQEKINLLKAFGVRVVICPTAVPPESPESYYEATKRIARETPGAFHANQYYNPDNPEAHYLTTGPEIWEATGGRITHFVVGMGTGGTISGAGRYLKEKSSAVRVIGADPVGSILAQYHRDGTMGQAHSYLVDGIGEDIIPGTTHFQYIDEVITVTDKESYGWTRRLSREEGILCGSSAGTAIAAAIQTARNAGPDDVVVVLLPDTGERYLSKAHNDEWLSDNGLLEPEELRVAQVLRRKQSDVRGVIAIRDRDPVRRAMELIRQHNISQIPVLDEEGKVVGTVQESTLMKALLDGKVHLEEPSQSIMEAALPRIASEELISRAAKLLAARNNALLVEEGSRVVGILSRYDLIEYVAQ